MVRKVAVVSPPLAGKGFAHLSQNRWFHYSCAGTAKIQPLLPSMAATILKNNGYKVLFLDGINRELTFGQFMQELDEFGADAVILETKAPVIRAHWEFIDTLKENNKELKVILVGDHISFFPEESLENSRADYCVTGGDYDLAVSQLLDSLNGKTAIPQGVWYKDNGRLLNTGRFPLTGNLDELPFIDRGLTDWKTYGEAYLHRPCAYIMSGRGCRGKNATAGRCKFCSWQYALWGCTARLRSPVNVAKEIDTLVRNYKVKEVFDDNESGAIYNTEWLKEFYKEMKAYKLDGGVHISSNARADTLDARTCSLLKKIGFRLLKIGLESASDDTLMRIGKGLTIRDIEEGVRNAKDCGLTVMLTIMIGYPWETEEDLRHTYEAAKKMLSYKTRLGDALQVSIIIPYPGTPLYSESLKNNWLTCGSSAYDKYDMSGPVLRSNIDTVLWGRKMWRIYWSPKFIFKSLLTLKTYQDFLLARRGLDSLIKHMLDWNS